MADKKQKLTTEQKELKKKCTVETPRFRLSYPQLLEAKENEEGQLRYSMSMIFDKDTDLTPLKKAIKYALAVQFGKDPSKWPKKYRNPIRDADKEAEDTGKSRGPEYKGKYFIGASATPKYPPQLFDRQEEDITDAKKLYAGCYCRAVLNAYWYDTKGNQGVAFGITAVQFLANGDKIGGGIDAKKFMSKLEDEEEDEFEDSDLDEIDEELDEDLDD